MGKEQGAAAYEERDLLEEASRGRSSAMCRRKSCEGPSGHSERRDGAGAGSEGSQLLCSECAPSLGGGEPQQRLSLQAADVLLQPPIPANKTQGMLDLPQLKQSQPANLKEDQIPLTEASRLLQPRVRRAPVGQSPCWPLHPHLSCSWQQVSPVLAEQQGCAPLPENNS